MTEDNLDIQIIQNIKDYIKDNNLSMKRIAAAAGMPYTRLWSLLGRSQGLKLSDYITLCRVFQEPLDKFIPKAKI
jgi:AraC-like DNA-binding protein